MGSRRSFQDGLTLLVVCTLAQSCATGSEMEVLSELPEIPEYAHVPHPGGYDLADLRSIFLEPRAPQPDTWATCDADFKKLKSLTEIPDEIERGARELVLRDAAKMHWCFYSKFIGIETEMARPENYLEDKQKAVIDAYAFLAPIARAFRDEYKDTRYLRWAIVHYRRLSEWVFYRRLEPTPDSITKLAETPNNPFSKVRKDEEKRSVLEKYGIEAPSSPSLVLPDAARAPAGVHSQPNPKPAL